MTLRLAFFGSDCLYSDIVLRTLLLSPHQVVAVILPASSVPAAPGERPIQALLPEYAPVRQHDAHALTVVSPFVQRSIVHTAWEKGIALYAVRDLAATESAGTLRMARADVACVACFPRRIPASLLHAPKHGFLNVHPSLLPAYRGPAPVFWQLRSGESRTGVTVHWLDAEFDTGPLADQRLAPLPDGISETDATSLLATAGAHLLAEVLARVAGGEIPYHPQPAGGTYQSYPHAGDFAISAAWPARRVYNFMCGAAVWGVPFRLDLPGETLLLSSAIAWSAHESLNTPLVRLADQVLIQCRPGTVRARLA